MSDQRRRRPRDKPVRYVGTDWLPEARVLVPSSAIRVLGIAKDASADLREYVALLPLAAPA